MTSGSFPCETGRRYYRTSFAADSGCGQTVSLLCADGTNPPRLAAIAEQPPDSVLVQVNSMTPIAERIIDFLPVNGYAHHLYIGVQCIPHPPLAALDR